MFSPIALGNVGRCLSLAVQSISGSLKPTFCWHHREGFYKKNHQSSFQFAKKFFHMLPEYDVLPSELSGN